jgi:hypothetical protein
MRFAMKRLIFTPSGNDAADRKIRRKFADGTLSRIAAGIYINANNEPAETILLREWPRLIAHLVPNGVVTDRTGFEYKPSRDPDGTAHIFVTSERGRPTIKLPGLSIHVSEGNGPLDNDTTYMGIRLASFERLLLDNLAPSRSRAGAPTRTLGLDGVRMRLRKILMTHGLAHLETLPERAQPTAVALKRIEELNTLKQIVSDLIGTQPHTLQADADCLSSLLLVMRFMQERAPYSVPDRDISPGRQITAGFIEAYFSNHIEGVRMPVDDAAAAIFDGREFGTYLAESKNIADTFQATTTSGMPISALSADEFIEAIRTTHRTIMASRSDIGPGIFKSQRNQAGGTTFVDPELVEGTLREGHAMIRCVDDGFCRGVLIHYLVAHVHPFTDGNGRTARALMNRELTRSNLSRIVIPPVFRVDYLDGLKRLSKTMDPKHMVAGLEFCQRVTAACSEEALPDAIKLWTSTHAFDDNVFTEPLTMPRIWE